MQVGDSVGWILQHSADPRIKMSLYVVSSNGPVTVYFGDSSLKSFLVWVVSGVASRLNIKQISSAILQTLILGVPISQSNTDARRIQTLRPSKSYPLCSLTCGAGQEIEEHPSSSQR